jgi:hypothetical protein
VRLREGGERLPPPQYEPLTAPRKATIMRIADRLQRQGHAVTGFEVHKCTLDARMAPLQPGSLRALLATRRWALFGRRRRAKTWSVAFGAFVDGRQDKGSGFVAFVHVVRGPIITSFVLLLPRFFAELSRLRDGGRHFDGFVAGADVAWDIIWLRCVFGVLYLIFYRKLRGRWRRSARPVCIVCDPREDRGVHLAAFQQAQAELDRRHSGAVQQVGLDHFPGLEAKFKEVNPRGHVVLGLGHTLKN